MKKQKKWFVSIIVFLVLAVTAVSGEYFFAQQNQLHAQSTPQMKIGDPLPANAFIELFKVINPTVVNISSSRNPRRQQYRQQFPGGQTGDPFFDMFQNMFPQQPMPRGPEQSLGTGFIIRPEGLILTNNHVVEGADVIKVQLSEKDKTLYTAKVIGRDQRSDLALIKIDAKKPLPAAKLGNSGDLQVGEWVAAFGNPLGLGHTMSKGIISALGREIEDLNRFPFLQTDASINPGNSGGPLVNLKGEVIGVNSAIAANSQGIGFAIPIDAAKPVISALEKDGSIRHGFLGIQIYPGQVNPQGAHEMGIEGKEGALIVGVVEGSPAAKAGLKPYDFVTKFNGKEIESSEGLRNNISDAEVGKSYPLELIRKGKTVKVAVTPEEAPSDKKQVRIEPKSIKSEKAPDGLGFSVSNYSVDVANEYGLPKLKKNYPVVTEVDPESPAAHAQLSPGDMIVDVNQNEVTTANDVVENLKKKKGKDTVYSMRILRGGYPLLLYLSPK